ncbi:hypothetical protein HHK36_028684 [Tetracentron sinense]|uniref:Bifunctional inhibitor/plant lipid transfer protein/seed storage helical domain-containing protein n=1 Tax=Tetracentron sinense TaxID=13715 RepID=A0A835D0G5_TETSI|nr:hypothetical protein HHK36_028684 [Tetracentron sinense]
MGYKSSSSAALFFLIFGLVSGCGICLNPTSPPASGGSCPRDALKLGVCANLLNGLIGANISNPQNLPCCTLLGGLVDLDVSICLCTALKANILGINLNIPISLSLIINICEKKLPSDFQCA